MTALSDTGWHGIDGDDAQGRLVARASAPTMSVGAGLHAMGLARERDALLYVPTGYRPKRPVPLAVMLHGAGGDETNGMRLLRGLADDAGVALLAPASRDDTWDVLLGGFGPDVEFIDAALDEASERCAIDPAHVAIGGFSDGASYALSLGLTNGDLFTHVIAFSPGFMAPAARIGAPRCYLSHGTRDAVLPIERCSRRIAPTLERAGYDVRYREFEGPHAVPADVARDALDWFARAAA
jgi:phospholipase/carboxylesterase